MVDLELQLEPDDASWVRQAILTHVDETGSLVAKRILDRWHQQVRHFKRVMPKDYKRVLAAMTLAEEQGRNVDEAVMAAAHG